MPRTVSGLLHSRSAFGIGLPLTASHRRHLGCGCSSVVEHDLAKVGVEGSSPFARSNLSKSTQYLTLPFGVSAFCARGCRLRKSSPGCFHCDQTHPFLTLRLHHWTCLTPSCDTRWGDPMKVGIKAQQCSILYFSGVIAVCAFIGFAAGKVSSNLSDEQRATTPTQSAVHAPATHSEPRYRGIR